MSAYCKEFLVLKKKADGGGGGSFSNARALCFLKADYILLNTTIWFGRLGGRDRNRVATIAATHISGIWNPPLRGLRKTGRRAQRVHSAFS